MPIPGICGKEIGFDVILLYIESTYNNGYVSCQCCRRKNVGGKKESLWDDCKLTSYTVQGKIYCLFLSFSYHQLNERIIIFYCTFPRTYIWQNWRTRVTHPFYPRMNWVRVTSFENVSCPTAIWKFRAPFRSTLSYISSNVCPHTYLHISSSLYHTFYFFSSQFFVMTLVSLPFLLDDTFCWHTHRKRIKQTRNNNIDCLVRLNTRAHEQTNI